MSLLEQLRKDRNFRKGARRMGMPVEPDPEYEFCVAVNRDGKPVPFRVPRGATHDETSIAAFEATNGRPPSELEMTLMRAGRQLADSRQET